MESRLRCQFHNGKYSIQGKGLIPLEILTERVYMKMDRYCTIVIFDLTHSQYPHTIHRCIYEIYWNYLYFYWLISCIRSLSSSVFTSPVSRKAHPVSVADMKPNQISRKQQAHSSLAKKGDMLQAAYFTDLSFSKVQWFFQDFLLWVLQICANKMAITS